MERQSVQRMNGQSVQRMNGQLLVQPMERLRVRLFI
jgi:hypothetical protein